MSPFSEPQPQPHEVSREQLRQRDPTVQLWTRLARPFRLAEVVDALFGLAPDAVALLGSTMLCASSEAEDLLRQMPVLLRSLTTSVQTAPIRVRGEIRGPVLWSETMSARAASFGDPDLFVCTTPQRDYDTAENQLLVHALTLLARAGRDLDRGGVDQHDDPRLRLARAHARQARHYLDHPALTGVDGVKIRPRVLKRVRGSKSAQRYKVAMTLVERAGEPLGAAELTPLCDPRTLRQHAVLAAVLDELESRGMRIPPLRVEAGSILAGPVTYVHPRRNGARDKLHGIVVGDVLLDVPEDRREKARDQAANELASRSHGRLSVLVLDAVEVPDAVDIAVRDARRRVAARRQADVKA